MMMWKVGCGAEVNKAMQKDTTSRDDMAGRVQFTNKGEQVSFAAFFT